ncbi:putative nucleic acid-binding Zn-ribbon protein [Paucibacter oligotrophus]|uniref:histidine kinase n=1 Tax=Roseateles oligotrophus TaxID=1769250 RepID=A0A840LA61_9BURK|nr:histidine kinase [Roseateles oligotrophus]MBB4843078.1 putative nucleic acid-binding Zn-ribbon protein [Roseateles oligotrophus]
MNATTTNHKATSPYERWQAFSAAVVQGFHVYASWLVSISWRRFVILSLALIFAANILQDLPPFTWRINEQVLFDEPVSPPEPPAPMAPKSPKQSGKPHISLDKPIHYEISIDDKGVRITPRKPLSASQAASAASMPASAASAPGEMELDPSLPSITVGLPKDADTEKIRQAIEEAQQSIEESVKDAREAAEQASQDAKDAVREATRSARKRTTVVRLGDFLPNLAVLLVLASAVIKITYKGRIQAEVKAAQATETAEAESLKRQVVEARMAAMQAQVEPHFLFNTLASIDHLIETDPPRASQMQKNLIALLRASMPTMREANASGVRDLGRELAVIKPYLEILKVRMEERLQTEIDVPEGLQSAEFPPMMIQSLVENAIKHGLEPKAEGGTLKVRAEILHGKLAVSVADTGLGFGRAATGGTGVGLANIRERLGLLYGPKASVTVAENQPSGCVVTITVPYRSRVHEGAQA